MFPVNFLDKKIILIIHKMALEEVKYPSKVKKRLLIIYILGVISLGQTQPGKVFGRLEIT